MTAFGPVYGLASTNADPHGRLGSLGMTTALFRLLRDDGGVFLDAIGMAEGLCSGHVGMKPLP
jgi:hypothetical protein